MDPTAAVLHTSPAPCLPLYSSPGPSVRASPATSLIVLLTACLAAPGCQNLPLSTGQSTAAAQPDSTAAPQAADDATSFAHSARRTFPEQGWWCGEFEEWLSPERAQRGYAIVLPGVEGTSFHNISIARGLIDAGFPGAVE